MPHQGCLFPGCQSPIHAEGASPVMESQAEACGNLHHFLVMCSRYCCLYPQYKPILENFYTLGSFDTAVCALASCNSKPCEGHRWCSAQHYLQWLKSFYQNLSPRQVCRLPGCPKHVYVERCESDGSPLKVHEFCGWRHCQKFHMLQSPAAALHDAVSDESEVSGQLEPSVDYAIESLKKYACKKTNVPRTMRVDEEFFTKHPWEVLNEPGHQACWLIAKCRWKDRSALKRELITKEGYHWKQQGKAFTHSDEVAKKYLTYTRLRQGKSKGKAQDIIDIEEKLDGCNDGSFSMIEYMVISDHPECKDYCVVKLQRGQAQCNSPPPSIPRKRKRSRGDQPTQRSINYYDEQPGLQDGSGNNYSCAMQEGGDNANNMEMMGSLDCYDDDHVMLQLLQQGFSSPALPLDTLSDLEIFIPNDV